MTYLYGKITYLPRRPLTPNGKKRLAKLFVTEGELIGKEIKFNLLNYPPPLGIQTGVIVRLMGYWQDDVFIIENNDQIRPAIRPQDIETLLRFGFPRLDIEKLIRAFQVNTLYDVSLFWMKDNDEFLNIISQNFNEDIAQALNKFFYKLYSQQGIAEIMDISMQYGLELDLPEALNIYDLLAHRARKTEKTIGQIIMTDPWLITQAENIPFKTGEKLAQALNNNTQEARYAGHIMHILWRYARRGHTYAPNFKIRNEVINAAVNRGEDRKMAYEMYASILYLNQRDLLAGDKYRGKFKYCKTFASEEIAAEYQKEEGIEDPKKAAKYGQALYLQGLYFSEVNAAKSFAALIKNQANPPIDPAKLLEEATKNFQLDEYQQEAIRSVALNPVTIITGQAGTGKTETLAALVSGLINTNPDLGITLMSPTGIAAQRLASKTKLAAATMHLRLQVIKDMEDYALPEEKRFQGAIGDVIIIDEMSMCNLVVFARLMKVLSTKENVRLVMAGDPAQLGSPGAGNVLKDLLKAYDNNFIPQGIKVVELQNIHRENPALENCKLIRQGNPNLIYKPKVFQHLSTDEPVAVLDKLLDQLINTEEIPPEDILILTPTRETGEVNAEILNFHLQKYFNPDGKQIANTSFRVGDRVMCVENDYADFDLNKPRQIAERATIFNGMTGKIVNYDEENDIMHVKFSGIKEPQPYIPWEAAYFLRLGYAATAHKAQGSEAPVVVFVEEKKDRAWLDRSIIYTAITRAKMVSEKPYSGRVYLIGPADFITNAVNQKSPKRNSKLAYRIKFYIENPNRDPSDYKPPAKPDWMDAED